jgi:hypothetical protein
LLLLDPKPIAGSGADGFEVTDISTDKLGSGIFGVRVDDVDDDGDLEIWCGDAAGHIHLFNRGPGGGWVRMSTNADIGMYPGHYNNIYPLKDLPESGETTRLVVVSPGYVSMFSVDASKVP